MSEIPSGSCDNNESLQDVCGNIEYNISSINSNKRTLQTSLKLVGTAKDNTGFRNKVSSIQNVSNKLASETTKYINKLKCEVPKTDKRLGLQAERLENSFIEAIKEYHALQKEILEKQKKHPLICVIMENPSPDEDNNDDLRQTHIIIDLKMDQERMLAKEQMMTNIHTEILDIHGLFKDIGIMIEDGGETIDKVEHNVTEVAVNIEKAKESLDDVLAVEIKSRKRCVIVIIIGIVIIFIIGYILYSKFG